MGQIRALTYALKFVETALILELMNVTTATPTIMTDAQIIARLKPAGPANMIFNQKTPALKCVVMV